MKTILLLVALSSLSFTQPYNVLPSEDIVIHRKAHMGEGKLSGNIIILSFPEEEILNQSFTCTPYVQQQANQILDSRPNGSEVFVIIENEVVTDIAICHEHDGVVVECGDPL